MYKEVVFFVEVVHLIKEEIVLESEYTHFATPKELMYLGIDHPWWVTNILNKQTLCAS